MKEILLTQGKIALVDDEDYERLAQYKWYYSKGCARRDIYVPDTRERKVLTMANEVLQTDERVDHISGKELDNQKTNLRVCTVSQNKSNSKKSKRSMSSKYKGVCFYKRGKSWLARIGLQDTFGQRFSKHLGFFSTEEKAAKAYDRAARHYFGKFAALNFPKEGEQSCL